MATYKEHTDNAISQIATTNALNNTTNPITISVTTGQGARFATITDGQYVTIWDKTTYADPLDDPAMEKATITARSTDSITLSRPAAQAHSGQPYVAELMRTVHLTDIEASVTSLEAVVATKSYKLFDCIVAPSGGDYTTLAAAYAAGMRKMWVIGAITETAQLAFSASGCVIMGPGRHYARITLPSDNTKYANFSGGDLHVEGVSFVVTDTNHSANSLGWVTVSGANNYFRQVGIEGATSTSTTTGCMMALGSSSLTTTVTDTTVEDCYFKNNNKGQALINVRMSSTSNGVRIRNNKLLGIQTMGFVYLESSSTLRGLHVDNNTAYVTSGHASNYFIDVQNGANNIVGCSFSNNHGIAPTSTPLANYIRITTTTTETGVGARYTGSVVSGNSVNDTSGKNGTIYMDKAPGSVVSGNDVDTITVFRCPDTTVSANNCYFLNNNGTACTDMVWTGNCIYNSVTLNSLTNSVYSGNSQVGSGGTSSMTSLTNCSVTGNVFVGTFTVSGTGNVVNNRVVGTLTDTCTASPFLATGTVTTKNGGFQGAYVAKSANYTLTSEDSTCGATGGGGGITITLPTAVGFAGRRFEVAKVDAGAGAITVATTSSQTISGGATVSLALQWDKCVVISDGANWIRFV